jgi:hypothetical protein
MLRTPRPGCGESRCRCHPARDHREPCCHFVGADDEFNPLATSPWSLPCPTCGPSAGAGGTAVPTSIRTRLRHASGPVPVGGGDGRRGRGPVDAAWALDRTVSLPPAWGGGSDARGLGLRPVMVCVSLRIGEEARGTEGCSQQREVAVRRRRVAPAAEGRPGAACRDPGGRRPRAPGPPPLAPGAPRHHPPPSPWPGGA